MSEESVTHHSSLITHYLLRPSSHNVLVGLLVVARAVAEGRLTPRGLRAGQADGGLALAAAVGMIARVHRRAAHRRADATVTRAAGLAQIDLVMLDVAHLADGPHAGG